MKLDDIDLIKREYKSGAIRDIRSVQSLTVYGRRSIVELPIPGSEGNVFQDMGRNPLVITLAGELVGPQAASTAQSLKEKFDLRKPVPFSSDFALASDVTSVIIERFVAHFVSGENLGIRYSMVIKEHKSTGQSGKKGEAAKKNKEETEPPSQEEEAKEAVEKKTEEEYQKSKTEWVEYTIKKGDTLSEIAASYDMSWQDLYNGDGGSGKTNKERLNEQKQEKGRPDNSIDNPDLIYPDDIILVPNKEPKKAEEKQESVHASDTVRHSNDTERRIGGGNDYTKLKEVKANKPVTGTIRVKVDAKVVGDAPGHMMVCINAYKDDVENSNYDPAAFFEVEPDEYSTFQKDIDVNLKEGDIIQIWCFVIMREGLIFVRNLKICFDPDIKVSFTNQDQ